MRPDTIRKNFTKTYRLVGPSTFVCGNATTAHLRNSAVIIVRSSAEAAGQVSALSSFGEPGLDLDRRSDER